MANDKDKYDHPQQYSEALQRGDSHAIELAHQWEKTGESPYNIPKEYLNGSN